MGGARWGGEEGRERGRANERERIGKGREEEGREGEKEGKDVLSASLHDLLLEIRPEAAESVEYDREVSFIFPRAHRHAYISYPS